MRTLVIFLATLFHGTYSREGSPDIRVAFAPAGAALPPPPPPPPCPAQGEMHYPDAEDCTSYYACREGVQTHRTCPDGLLYNIQAESGSFPCDFPDNVVCVPLVPIVPALPRPPCPPRGVEHFPHLDHCDSFFECREGEYLFFNCPSGLLYNIEAPNGSYPCDYPENVYCETSPPHSSLLSCHDVPPMKKYTSPYDCRQFYMCLDGSPRLQYCEYGKVFSEEISSCTVQEEVPECNNYYHDSSVQQDGQGVTEQPERPPRPPTIPQPLSPQQPQRPPIIPQPSPQETPKKVYNFYTYVTHNW